MQARAPQGQCLPGSRLAGTVTALVAYDRHESLGSDPRLDNVGPGYTWGPDTLGTRYARGPCVVGTLVYPGLIGRRRLVEAGRWAERDWTSCMQAIFDYIHRLSRFAPRPDRWKRIVCPAPEARAG